MYIPLIAVLIKVYINIRLKSEIKIAIIHEQISAYGERVENVTNLGVFSI